MCSRGVPGAAGSVLLVALLGLGAPAPSGAQTVDDLVQRLDSLTPLLAEAEEAVERAEQEERRQAREALGVTLDTLRVGPMRIVTPIGQTSDARRAFEAAWEDAAPRVGDATGILTETIWTFQYAPRLHPLHVFIAEHPRQRKQVHLRSWTPWDRVVGAVERKLWNRLGSQVEGEAGELIGRTWGAWWPLTPEILARTHRALVTGPGRTTRACLEGDREACWVAIGAGEAAERWEEWYEPAERRAAVLSRPSIAEGAGRAQMEACERGAQDACDEILDQWSEPQPPLANGDFRIRLVAHAVELGGDGAYARLVEADGSELREALSRTAGVDADEVMTTWRTRVLEHRPEAEAGVGRSQWSTLFWMVVFGLLAMGSTRWRVG